MRKEETMEVGYGDDGGRRKEEMMEVGYEEGGDGSRI